MKNRKTAKLIALLLALAMMMSLTACAPQYEAANENADNQKNKAVAENGEEATGVNLAFSTRLDYLGEKDGIVEASVVLEAQEGVFDSAITAGNITVKLLNPAMLEGETEINVEENGALAENLEIVSSNRQTVELGFTVPQSEQGEQNVDDLALWGAVTLAEGTMYDEHGNTAGEMQTVCLWNINMNDRSAAEGSSNPPGYVIFDNKGGYTVEFILQYSITENGKTVQYTHKTGRLTFGSQDNYYFPAGAYDYSVNCNVWNGSIWKTEKFDTYRSDTPFNCVFTTYGALPNCKMKIIKD